MGRGGKGKGKSAPPAPEKKIDPEDGQSYTWEELSAWYKGKYKKNEISQYWESTCKSSGKKGKAKAEPVKESKSKNGSKADPKAKSKAKAKPEPKAKAKAEPEAKAKPERPKGRPAQAGQYFSGKPINVSALTKLTKDDLGLYPQPLAPTYKTCLVGCYVRSAPFGGADKSSNGHRYDSIPIANGMIAAGMSCQLINYIHDEHDKFFEVVKKFDAIIVRCNPGQIKADGGSQEKFDDDMRKLRKMGMQVWPSPDVMEFMGAKDALCKIATLKIGLEDTLAYYTESDFSAGFKKTMAFQPRVIKQNRGSAGEGIWIIKLKSGDYCKSFGERSCADSEVLDMMEANDNHSEEHTVGEFIEFCVNGRTGKSGKWESKGTGKYLEGGKEAGGQLVDQRFCPRIVEGELRYNLVCDELVGIIHKKPKEGGISAVGGTGSIYTFYGPKEKKFANLTKSFLTDDMKKVMPNLGLDSEPIPLWWTSDFINSSPTGTAAKDEKWIVGEFNCSCVGISKCLDAYAHDEKPEACYSDIEKKDLKEANRVCEIMGVKATGILAKLERSRGPPAKEGEDFSSGPVDASSLTKLAKDDLGLLPQPGRPKYKCCLVGCYVRDAKYGGADKSSNGHRYDSIPMANGMIQAGMSCQLINYVHQEHDKFFAVVKNFDAIIVRCNPGQIKADGGSQEKFDDGMRGIRKLGIQVWPSPDVMEFMGAKDALCKIASLQIGLEDTLAYYDEKMFAEGFKKTMAFQPRVIKQNRGSAGEGIWIIKLKSGDYCKEFGERSCGDSEVLDMMEANDNHSEEHSVGEFIEFCVNGRTGKSGKWESKGTGKYLEGGKEAGGQLVDQRFCPRIVEGELRYNLVCDELVGIIHKKPKEGGISAVGGTGSIYTYYGPKEKKFASLTKSFLTNDMKKVMPSLGLGAEPLPIWWTSDFINSSPPGTAAAQEKWIVGEFNCSCVGISKCLPAYCSDENPTACFSDIPKKDLQEAKRMGSLMGKKGMEILARQAKKPKFTLGYWGIRGLAAPLRMMLEYTNAQYIDVRYGSPGVPDWHGEAKAPLKDQNALINLPYVELNGKVVTQSNACFRFVGKKLGLNGRGDDASVSNDEVLCQAMDLRDAVIGMVYPFKGIKDRKGYETAMKKSLTDGDAIGNFTKFEGYLKQAGTTFMCGNKPCTGDFHVFEMLDQHEMMAKDLKMPSPLEKYPGLKAYYDKFKSLPQLEKYFESEAYKLPVNAAMAHFK
jgi:glutathione synthase/RimK-type ligase-like ATP-grasp enzyme